VRSALAGVLALLTLAQNPQQPIPRFRSGVDVVLLDVTVLDRNRRPVRGLTAADFTILEDNREQPIVSFEELSAPEPDGSVAPWMREVAPDVRTNSADHRRLVMIVLNDAQISFRYRDDVKRIGHAIVDRLGPADQASIVFTGNNGRSQDFTNDRRVLRATIERYVETSMPPELAAKYSIGTVRRAAQLLIDIPHRRKALIWVGGRLLSPLQGGVQMAPVGSPSGTYGTASDGHFDLLETIKHAQRANVTVYTVSPSGLEAPGPGTTHADLSLESLNGELNETGGFAITNTSNFDPQIAQIFRETGSYYLLGFSSPHDDGRFRRVEVNVNRPGLTVRTRNGYYAREAKEEQKRAGPNEAPLPLAKAMSGILPMPDMPMRVSVAPFALSGADTADVAIVLGMEHPTPGGRVVEKVDVLVQAFDADSRPRGWFRQIAQLTFRPAEGSGAAKYEVLSKLALRPGRYQLRFAVHSASLGKSGSVYQDVEVPDFRRQPVSLSGLVMSVEAALPVAPRDFLAKLLPISPTTQRSFARSDQVTAYVRAYAREKNAPRSAVLTTVVLDENNRQVHLSEGVMSELTDGFSADHLFHLPLQQLEPGAYLLRFELTADKTQVRREARFYVREK
jgi:VWFA-related protein